MFNYEVHELDEKGLIRSPSLAIRKKNKLEASLNDERRALVLLIQNSITGYVMLTEGREQYKGVGNYDLAYIKKSENIKEHRKQDITKIDSLLNEAESKKLPAITLAHSLFQYLNTIKTGVNFLWLVRIGKSSQLRDQIHAAIMGFDPMMFWLCFIEQVENYQQYSKDKPDSSKLQLANCKKIEIYKDGVSVNQYESLKLELANSKLAFETSQNNLAEQEGENIALTTTVNAQAQRIYQLERMLYRDQEPEQKYPDRNVPGLVDIPLTTAIPTPVSR